MVEESVVKRVETPLTRFDRNVANNILDFSMYRQDANLIKDLAFFFAHDFQHKICKEDLIGRKVLDPEQFSKIVGRDNYRSLLNKHPDPAQFHENKFKSLSQEELKQLRAESKTENGEPLYESWLDNALYRCRYESMRFSKKGKTPNGYTSSELGEIKFLKYVKKMFQPSTKKIYYEYELDETFINDLARYFLKFDFNIYKGLEKPSFQDFYIALITIRDRFNVENLSAVRVEWQFDKLCEIARTNCRLPEDRKKHINRAIREINKQHGKEFVSIRWDNNGRFNYKPILSFSLTDKELLEKQSEAKLRYQHYTIVNLKAKFRENFSMIKDESEFKQTFIKWLKNPDWLFEVKHSVVIHTYVQCFGKMPINKTTKEEDVWDSTILTYIKETIPQFAENPIF